MGYNAQARKWLMVINNPAEAGLDHAAIMEIVLKFHPTYFCMADEIATTGTFHTHIFFCTQLTCAAFPPSKSGFQRRILNGHTAHREKTKSTFPKQAFGPIQTRWKPLYPAPLRSGASSRQTRGQSAGNVSTYAGTAFRQIHHGSS